MSFPPVFQLIKPIPLPVTIVPDPVYTVPARARSGAVLATQALLYNNNCLTDLIAGYNSDPVAATLSYVQLHDSQVAIIAGAVPAVVIPVYGGKLTYSFGVQTLFLNGLVIALSTTELTFTPPAGNYLAYNANFRTT